MPMPALLCFSTCPDAATAERIATALVAERLAACVNLLPGLRSVYRWQGKVEVATEAAAIFKGRADKAEALMARIAELHSYDVPAITIWPVETAWPTYAEWVEAEG